MFVPDFACPDTAVRIDREPPTRKLDWDRSHVVKAMRKLRRAESLERQLAV